MGGLDAHQWSVQTMDLRTESATKIFLATTIANQLDGDLNGKELKATTRTN